MALNLNEVIKVGEYLRVEQQVVCYEAGEIAHIENVMIGETRERKNTYLEREERTTESESISENEQERDTQTSERFAMQRESEKIMNQDLSFDVSLSLSGKAGPVNITANTGFSMSQSTMLTDKNATEYSKSVVERARNRTFQRTRNYEKLTVIKQWEDINLHSFKNEPLEGEEKSNNIGIYRWVDKKYENKLMNYGKRLMLNLNIPDPAAWHRKAATFLPTAAGVIVMPEKPQIEAKDINDTNYLSLAAKYGVTGIKYPLSTVIISNVYEYNTDEHLDVSPLLYKKGIATYHLAQTDNKGIIIDEGYVAKSARVEISIAGQINGTTTASIGVNVGDAFFGKSITIPNSSSNTWWTSQDIAFSREYSKILPIAMMSYIATSYYVTVIVHCHLTQEAFQSWQLDTYNAIMDAYNRQLADYERNVNALKENSTLQYGNNPTKNRLIEQQELKKGAISLLAGNSIIFNFFNNIVESNGYPQINMGSLDFGAPILQFFENAFEWEIMSYKFYPYFWQFDAEGVPAPEGRWAKVYSIRDNDDVFEKFLQAGYANVILTVKPGYENMVLHYLENGVLLDAKFVSKVPVIQTILKELEKAVNINHSDPTVVSSWHTKAPTNLVILQTSAKGAAGIGLPCWQSDDKRLNPDLITTNEHFGPLTP